MIDHTFTRGSGFYKDKHGNWLSKRIEVNLGYFDPEQNQKLRSAGTVVVDMWNMIGKGPLEKTFSLQMNPRGPILSAKFECTFKIEEVDLNNN